MEFNGDDSKITGDKAIANGFNNFFVNIGPSLAKRIPKCVDILFTQYLPDKIDDTMFLQPVTEEEILQLVVNAKSKKSKDHDQFDMCLVKKIIPHIVKPLAHICNTSLNWPSGLSTEPIFVLVYLLITHSRTTKK